MDPATRRRLVEGAARLGVAAAPLLSAFARYLELLVDWNHRINLTRVTEPAEVVDRHLLDSLAAAPHLPAGATVVDVGSGAGFPGVPLCLARPDLRVTLVESIQKKAAFLRALARELPLDLEILAERSQVLVEARRRFDVAVSRAALPPAAWLAHARDLVRPGGLILLYMGDRLAQPPSSPDLLSPTVVPYVLPSGRQRRLALFHVEPGALEAPPG